LCYALVCADSKGVIIVKNGKLVTAMLDHHAETIRLMRSDKVEDVAAAGERFDQDTALWFVCIDDGWTVAELDKAFERRFGRVVRRGVTTS
jgi:hypothetical protein